MQTWSRKSTFPGKLGSCPGEKGNLLALMFKIQNKKGQSMLELYEQTTLSKS